MCSVAYVGTGAYTTHPQDATAQIVLQTPCRALGLTASSVPTHLFS